MATPKYTEEWMEIISDCASYFESHSALEANREQFENVLRGLRGKILRLGDESVVIARTSICVRTPLNIPNKRTRTYIAFSDESGNEIQVTADNFQDITFE